MAGDDDFSDDDYYDGDEVPGLSRRKWIGAILAVLIVGGFGIGIWYAYDQGVKKGVQLAPPIISADTAPVKEKPEDPGGMDIPNQDKRVFGVLNSGEAPDKVEKLMQPPEEAVTDTASEETPVTEGTSGEGADTLATGKPESLIAKPLDAPADGNTATDKSETAALPPVTDKQVVEDRPTVAAPEPKSVAPEPKPEPKSETAAAKPAPATSGGTKFRVQLGSFSTADAAEKQWSMLQSKYKSLLSDMSYRVQDFDVKGKGTYHRLQAGAYDSRGSATSLCEKLKAQKQDCLVVSG
ncbi:SPOR domain-containing protein [Sneathiella sp.]|uniref:SPOR domain-containing protein n=1 Tax=Sneathiella sp. TaxID=1964365 RepID=UPI003565D04B